MNTMIQTQVKAETSTFIKPPHKELLQRKCASHECEERRKKRLNLQRSSTSRTEPAAVPPIVNEVLVSSGQPLDPSSRVFMESRFGHDLSQLRVHTDSKAAESARAVNALAYTVGRDVVFGSGNYSPGTVEGRKLIAHELTHVLQQTGSDAGKLQRKLSISEPGDTSEREADRIAETVTNDLPIGIPPITPVAPALARSCTDGRCESCAGGRRDFWVTAYFRRRANEATMNNLRQQINGAKAVLANCCLDLKFDFNWTLLRGPAVFPAGTARPAGSALGAWDYPADAEALGEGLTFSGARGVPMLVVDDVPGSGGGVTMWPGLDVEYTGRDYFAISVNQTGPNPNCNHIAHELWHVATRTGRHDPAEGAITACTSNAVSLNYCNALRGMVAPR